MNTVQFCSIVLDRNNLLACFLTTPKNFSVNFIPKFFHQIEIPRSSWPSDHIYLIFRVSLILEIVTKPGDKRRHIFLKFVLKILTYVFQISK
jgi:hypothetical protein